MLGGAWGKSLEVIAVIQTKNKGLNNPVVIKMKVREPSQESKKEPNS